MTHQIAQWKDFKELVSSHHQILFRVDTVPSGVTITIMAGRFFFEQFYSGMNDPMVELIPEVKEILTWCDEHGYRTIGSKPEELVFA